MGSRSRKRRVRGEEADALTRQGLAPLRPGERPRAVTVAAIVSALLAAGNVITTVLADDVKRSDWNFTILQTIVLVVAAVGMWRAKYWAVLGFQALLTIQIIQLAAGATLGDHVLGQVVFGAVAVALSVLFWFLIRAMARLQMPERPGARES